MGHGDAIAWNAGSAVFGITVGRFSKQHGKGELAEDDAYPAVVPADNAPIGCARWEHLSSSRAGRQAEALPAATLRIRRGRCST